MMRHQMKAERLGLAALVVVFVWFTWRGLTMFYTGDDLMNTYFAWQISPGKIVKAEFLLWMPLYRPLGALIYRSFYWLFGFHPEPLYVLCWLLLCINVFAAFEFFKTVMGSGKDALIALSRTRAAYEAATQTTRLQEQSLEIEQEKFDVGLSTNFLVIQYQSYVAQARSTEVAALDAYAKAKTQYERSVGLTLDNHNVSIDEAFKGVVQRTSTPNTSATPPALPPAQRPQ